ncbi:hypothetical protein J6590_015108 [Homalodisca vitripennis]|nr:hypothetical protein J6590_015108 [Homalodisca vitripennis]
MRFRNPCDIPSSSDPMTSTYAKPKRKIGINEFVGFEQGYYQAVSEVQSQAQARETSRAPGKCADVVCMVWWGTARLLWWSVSPLITPPPTLLTTLGTSRVCILTGIAFCRRLNAPHPAPHTQPKNVLTPNVKPICMEKATAVGQ